MDERFNQAGQFQLMHDGKKLMVVSGFFLGHNILVKEEMQGEITLLVYRKFLRSAIVLIIK